MDILAAVGIALDEYPHDDALEALEDFLLGILVTINRQEEDALG